jgi:glyoxylase-like metal-dependent hydrolase (beta-lactamase superfamily II)
VKLFFHYCSHGFSNCYILGADKGEESDDTSLLSARRKETAPPPREAIIVDPGNMDDAILNFIETNEYRLRGVLVTHDHINHVRGLKTLKRIYDADIYAVNHVILDHKTNLVRDGDVIEIGPFKITVFSVPGHSADSAVFRIGRLLFTGDALSAGLVGRTASTYGAVVQMTALKGKILSLPGDYVVLPGHGPPSSLETERRFNIGVRTFDETRSRRPVFRVNY